jgi:hypothetical protein
MALVLLGCCFGFALIELGEGRYGTAAALVIIPAALIRASQFTG